MSNKKLVERLKKKRQELKTRSEGFAYFMVKEGTTRMRPLPVEEEKDWAQEIVFFFLGKDIGGIVSPATFGKKCPVMKLYNKLSQSKDDDDRSLAKKFKPSKKYMVPHIKYMDEKGKEVDEKNGPKLCILTAGQYQDLLDLYLDDEQGDFTDIRKGYDIKYKREGKTLTDTEYNLTPCKPTPLPKKYAKMTFDPEEMTRKLILPYEELKVKLEQFIGGSSSEDDDDAPKKSRGDKKKKKKSHI